MAKNIELKINLDAASELYRAIGMIDAVAMLVDRNAGEALTCAMGILDGVFEDAVARAKVNGGDPCGENEYKKLYEQLLEDFEHALHYAGKNNNVCNFCGNDCGEGGACKGREDWIECTPKWRGIVKGGDDEGVEE